MAKSSLRINRGNVEMEITNPIDTTGYSRETKDELMEKVRTVMCQGFNGLKNEE
jgi:hypothetical protein